ncbi:protein MLN51 homolog isoform X2 [Manihot esculenta]|uniref:Btz domain-containing protein n=1 Tax=Manihot esculenta TaxID=3983 RepID=A0A2C9UYI1_MANES|nr:protein MLN51 homolog isoform X2 [Manihot esculenta]XP_021628003.1 protein MLN51 homolog isoform X2 [Manihot esculenta]
MAKVGEEDIEYESDPEEEKRLLGMRRREAASDDEEVEGEEKPTMERRAPIHSDESDGQGGAAEYEDDEEELEGEDDEEEVYEDEEAYGDEEEEYEIDEIEEGKEGTDERGGGHGGVEVEEKGVEGRKVDELVEIKAVENHLEEEEEEEEEDQEGKKENEPFAVPTAGAFYMHDDRFRDNAGGRHRRTYVGRKLWESKDDKKWGHDKFEEMDLQERRYEQGRRGSKGNFRGRGGKNQAPDRGYGRRNKSKTYSNSNNQNQAPISVRGRGPRKYESTWKTSSLAPPAQNKQPGKSLDKTSRSNSGRAFTPTPNTESDQVPTARKHSSLSSASPPFYPSGSSNKDIPLTQKRDIQAGSTSRNIRTSVMDESFSIQQTNALIQGKNIAASVGIDKLYIDDSVASTAAKSLNTMQKSSGSSLVNGTQSSQSRNQGRGVSISSQMTYQSAPLQNQVNRVSSSTQPHSIQRSPVQNRAQPSVQVSGQQLGQRPGSGSQASSPPKTALSINSCEPGEAETNSESSKSRSALVGKGKGSSQGSGRGSFMYGGAQVMGASGNMGVGHGDQNFPATPAFLPVMQFGGQHPGGIGVPAVGMAFPGYVAQSQLGLGNSEMTWLPVLAGAAGALGATYCSPYIAVDGAYHARPSGQTSSVGSLSKENNGTNKTNNEWKLTSQRPELVNDEFGQRQKPRRYSEMDFKQPSPST